MNFFKAHNFGNDFVIIDARENPGIIKNCTDLTIALCDRRRGIGADGCLIVLRSKVADVKMLIINADGSPANMCGNGVNCLARYLIHRNLVQNEIFTVETVTNVIKVQIIQRGRKNTAVKIELGVAETMVREKYNRPVPLVHYPIEVRGKKIYITSISIGVPHTIIFVRRILPNLLVDVGPLIEKHRLFSEGTNVSLVKIINRNNIAMMTHERGVGLTMACGTGAAAAAMAAYLGGKTTNRVTVHLPLGKVMITIKKNGSIAMTGLIASIVCEGKLLEPEDTCKILLRSSS